MNYSFPPTKWVLTATPEEQIEHVHSEWDELACEEVGSEKELEEAIDLYHSLETYFRICERQGVNIAQCFADVEKKNRDRGYYLEEERL